MSKVRVVHIPAMAIEVENAPDDISSIYMALAKAHNTIAGRAKVTAATDAPAMVLEG